MVETETVAVHEWEDQGNPNMMEHKNFWLICFCGEFRGPTNLLFPLPEQILGFVRRPEVLELAQTLKLVISEVKNKFRRLYLVVRLTTILIKLLILLHYNLVIILFKIILNNYGNVTGQTT